MSKMDLFWDTFSKNEKLPGLVTLEEIRRFMNDCFIASAVCPENAKQMVDLLAEADYRGHYSHGMSRLSMYLKDIQRFSTDGNAKPEILNETAATAWVEGKNGLGAVVGNFCMDLAIKKAKTVGIGLVAVKGSNHFGIAGWYSLRAMKEGLIGIAGSNTPPLMMPTRAKDAGLGTNPLSFGAPADNGDNFLLDMATTAVALGKIEIQKRKGKTIPPGWAYDTKGQITVDAQTALDSKRLAPLGGDEKTGGYKGFGLGAMVEVMCGILSGSLFSTKIRQWEKDGEGGIRADLGHFFIAIDPKCFAPGFTGRMSEMNKILRSMTASDPNDPVLIAGDPERNHMKKVDKEGGVQYTQNQIDTCNTLAAHFNVAPLKFTNRRK